MTRWDTVLVMLVTLAIVAVVIGSTETTGAIVALGNLLTTLVQNVVGVPDSAPPLTVRGAGSTGQ